MIAKTKKLIFLAMFLVVIIVAAVFLMVRYRNNKSRSGKLEVVATLFPLYDFTKNIGQEKIEISLLLPPGVEAHSFEPKPSDILKINGADIFVYTGKFMEPWAEDIIKGIPSGEVKIIDVSHDIELLKENDNPDPHIWLDFDNAEIIVDNIAISLMEKDPANAPYYQRNADNYKYLLTILDNKYKAALSACQEREIIYGGHYAFGYLAKKYGLHYTAAQGFSPNSEPTAKDLINLVNQIKRDNIKYVFYEELSSPKIAEMLSGETQAEMLLLNAGHNISKEDFENNASFIKIMEDNLTNLKIGLGCE